MEKFIVSARKYRPSTFGSVVGQQHITTTLKNAIKSKQIAQAFLFCGPRGVGKTTSARILAKTINCLQLTTDTEPCNECESCKAFIEGRSLNIIELDAASNNSVDDIRELVDQVRFAPISGDYKVYIIDEVHMLSGQAFNAFLKTLEEPPSHAVFILATTEKHKIIPTILSRCQIFDFNRITVSDMARHLAEIAQKEGIKYEEEGLHIIAEKADGGLRDALSMFDQISTFSGGNLSYDTVINNLNILDYDEYFRLVDQLNEGNLSACLLQFNQILARGFESEFFVQGLSSHLRNLLVSRDAATLQLLEASDRVKNKFKVQAAQSDIRFMIACLDLATKTEVKFRNSINKRLLVELALMQMCELKGLGLQDEKKKSESVVNSQKIEEKVIEPITKSVSAEQTISILPETISKDSEPVHTQEEGINTAQVQPFNNVTIKQTEVLSTDSVITEQKLKPGEDKIESEIKPEEIFKPKFSKPSIGDLLTDIDKKSEDSVSKIETRQELFTDETLQKIWKQFAGEQTSPIQASLRQTMLDCLPYIKNDFEIEVKLMNAAQNEIISQQATQIRQYLSDQLKNDFIKLNFLLENEENRVRKPYSNEEKYSYLIKKNPNIEKLRNALKLDI